MEDIEDVSSKERDSPDQYRDRRRFLSVGASVVGIGALGIGLPMDTTRSQSIETTRSQSVAATKSQSIAATDESHDLYEESCDDVESWDVTVEQAELHYNRHCAVPCSLVDSDELAIGQQIRVASGETTDGFPSGVYTVASKHDGDTVRLTNSGLDRLGLGDGASASIGATAVHPTYDTRQGGRLNNEYVEYLVGDGDSSVIAIAPHGGFIEFGTDFEAERVAELTGGTGWICSGFNDGPGTYARWHTPSTDIHRRSFPVLDEQLDRDFEWGVSFHGYTDDEILVGGTAAETDLEVVVSHLTEQIPDVPVTIVENDATEYAGSSPENVLNRLAPIGRTIQLEQPTHIRQQEWAAVADAIADAIEALQDS